MLAAIRSEFRKLLTVRSTYAITIIAFLLVGFIAYWSIGYKSSPVLYEGALQQGILNCITLVQTFGGIVAVLLITHEYRYNTIAYTLTTSNRRLKVLLAKTVVVAAYGVFLAAATAILAGLLITFGAHVADHSMGTQQLAYWDMAWKSIVFVVGGVLAALLFGFMARSVTFAIVAYFIVPTTVEPILSGILKIKSNYLPFMAQGQILSDTPASGAFSPLASAGVFGAYLLGAWIIAAILFIRKDAN